MPYFFRSSGFAIDAFDHREMGDCCTFEVASVSKVPSYCHSGDHRPVFGVNCGRRQAREGRYQTPS
jgi:hypothetical protein